MSRPKFKSSKSMRGLHAFISDIRLCQTKETEKNRISKETAKIRKYFALGKVDGYQRKKCVCKLLYIFMLGYEVDFGYMEAVTLLSSEKFGEKQIGYLAIGILLHETHDMIPLIINTLQRDLEGGNEFYQSLALTAVGNIGGKEMAEQLTPQITQLLLGNSKILIRKKAALCLLNMFRKYPEIVTPDSLIDKLGILLKKFDIGLLTSVMSLVLGMASVEPEPFGRFVNQIILILSKIALGKDFPPQYIYYGIANPWLQVKLLRFLRYYPPATEPAFVKKLLTVLDRILGSAQSARSQSINHKNSLNCVLFEAIALVIHLDMSSSLLRKAAALLGGYIKAKETNVRYLGLETMAHLALVSEEGNQLIKGHQRIVQQALGARDISIRRRALDLLFGMCNAENAQSIVSNLLEYLKDADYEIREELVIKISILAEKFAPTMSWYVDVILELLRTAGDSVNDEIWHRVVQIVTNNESVQEYASKAVFEALQYPAVHETTVKVSAYILGEFGHLIGDNAGTGPREQFEALHAKFSTLSVNAKALLFSSYIKLINLYPELQPIITPVLKKYSTELDSELQQRACEYYNLAMYKKNPDLMDTVLQEMPVFAERETTTQTVSSNSSPSITRREREVVKEETLLDDSPQAAAPTPSPTAPSLSVDDLLGGGDDSLEMTAPPAEDTKHFKHLCVNPEGILHQDDVLQIGVKSQYQKQNGRLMLYYGNVTTETLEDFSATVSPCPGLKLNVNSAPSTVGPKQQAQQLVNYICVGPFKDPPILTVSMKYQGRPRTLKIKAPIIFTKFVEGLHLDAASFFQGWKQVTSAPYEHMEIFQAKEEQMNDQAIVTLVQKGLHLEVLKDVDPNPANSVAAGKFFCAEKQVSLLLRLEANPSAKMFRLTVRTFDAITTSALFALLKSHLASEEATPLLSA